MELIALHRGQFSRRVVLVFSFMAASAVAFQPAQRIDNGRGQWTRASSGVAPRMAAMDPTDLVHAASSVMHQQQNHPVDITTSWETLLSTLYTVTSDTYLKPAHGHSQPLFGFGTPDPYLSNGVHSIAPNLKAVMDSSSEAARTTPALDQLPEAAQSALKNGWKIVDGSKFEGNGGSVLPGFKPTDGLLSRHFSNIPEASMASFTSQVFSSAKFLRVLEKLPMAAFVYVLIDFFLLRPGADIYKEDIEEEPLDVAAETVSVTGVRLSAFAAIAILTVLLFD